MNGLPEAQATRACALFAAALVVSRVTLDPPGDESDLEDITTGMAERFAYWVATGRRRANNGI